MASGTITNPNKLTSTDTTLKGITFYYTRIGQVVQCVIGDGATTSALANGQELGDIPMGFIPYSGADIRDSLSNKRLRWTWQGKIVAGEAIPSGTYLRGMAVYLTGQS